MKKMTTIFSLMLISSTVFAMSRTERNFRAFDILFKSERIAEMEKKAMLKSIEILGSDASKVTLKLTYITGMGQKDQCSIVQPVLLPELQNIMLGDIMLDNCPQ